MQTLEEYIEHEKWIIRQDCEADQRPLPADMEQAARDALLNTFMEMIEKLEREVFRLEAFRPFSDEYY